MYRKLMVVSTMMLLTITLAVTACGPTATPQVVKEIVTQKETVVVQAEAESVYDRIKRTGTVLAGFFNEPPAAYVDPATGKVTGTNPEIARAVMQKIFGPDIKVEGVLVSEFGSLIPGLQADRFDMIASGLYIRPERCEQVLFSDPELTVHTALLVEKGNPLNLHSVEDIRDTPGIKLGLLEGGAQTGYAKAVGVPEDIMVILQNYEQALAAFDAGRIDVFYGSSANTMAYRLNNIWKLADKLEIAEPFSDPVIDGKPAIVHLGAAFRIGEEDLRDAYNEKLAELKESGELAEILATFSVPEIAINWEVTWEEACKQ